MKWNLVPAALLFLVTSSVPPVYADFDFEAYRDHLAATRYLSAAELVASYEPFGPYVGAVPRREVAPHYFAEIDAELQLRDDELALLQQHDFVVSQRWRRESYGKAFEWVWHADLPVFISTDAILHAVHRSYDQLLEATEVTYFLPMLDHALTEMYSAWPELQRRYAGNPEMDRCLADVDVYLTVARRLLEASEQVPSQSGSETEVAELLTLIRAERMVTIVLFSEDERDYDFSQFKLRGHYAPGTEGSDNGDLQRYFRCMMWLGRTEFRFGHPDSSISLAREITDAFLLRELVEMSGTGARWDDMDRVLRGLIAAPDNLTLADLERIADTLGLESAAAMLEAGTRSALADELANGPYAAQRILSQVLTLDPLNPAVDHLPFAFFLFGQRFLPDAFIAGQVVYPFTPCDDPLNPVPPCRLMPDPLDVLFAFGNDDALPFMQGEVELHEYARNLSALRYLMDVSDAANWSQSLYTSWLQAIRTLSKTGRTDGVPQFMTTGAWQQEKMNTQLAAWAEIRHDNLLYGKPSYTGDLPTCSYPHTYVEPVPAFYEALEVFAEQAADVFSSIPQMSDSGRFFANMRSTLDKLGRIAEKELAGGPFTEEEESFLRSVVYQSRFIPPDGEPCSHGYLLHDGWYPKLIYATYEQSYFNDDVIGSALEPDALVADVHTDPNKEQVLHVATGDPELGIFVASLPGCEAIAYVGPVASYHQFVTSGFQRLSDEEWNEMYRDRTHPARPGWSNVYLAGIQGEAVAGGSVLVAEPPLATSGWSLPGPLDGPDDDPGSPPDSTDTPPDDGPGSPPDSTDTPPDDGPGSPPDSTDTPPDDGPGSPPDSTGTPPDEDPDGSGDDPNDEIEGFRDDGTPFFVVSPNPAHDGAMLSFRLARPVTRGVALSIFNSEGGLVRSFKADGGANLVHVRWDGKDTSGQKASAGVYYVALEAGPETVTRKVVVIR